MVMGDGYQLVHEQTFDYALNNELDLAPELAEEAIGSILYALSRNPFGFRQAFGDDIRIAKMTARPRDGLPAFRVFFRAKPERMRVDLLYVDHG